MNHYTLKALFFTLCSLAAYQLSWAEETPLKINYWQCISTDAENKTWVSTGKYELTAINQSFANCKKESTVPRTCTAAKSACEEFVNGLTTKPMWQCVALDKLANKWTSNLYTTRYDAAFAAEAYCKDKSSIPLSCYMNLLTCRNLNAQNDVGE